MFEKLWNSSTYHKIRSIIYISTAINIFTCHHINAVEIIINVAPSKTATLSADHGLQLGLSDVLLKKDEGLLVISGDNSQLSEEKDDKAFAGSVEIEAGELRLGNRMALGNGYYWNTETLQKEIISTSSCLRMHNETVLSLATDCSIPIPPLECMNADDPCTVNVNARNHALTMSSVRRHELNAHPITLAFHNDIANPTLSKISIHSLYQGVPEEDNYVVGSQVDLTYNNRNSLPQAVYLKKKSRLTIGQQQSLPQIITSAS